ncbi:hypothetical protein FW755_05955 [Lonepinella koalarum]|uniref:Uncharacterized protein n=1 Tax=Lonepinella koalarum TaxID=53417 RepID=A0A4R1KZX9_9PAST|nr:hypothetical protein [Lonepinella koalarum]MDH2925993.1 hypothetical protein [Lonepinella koalarum]TCK71146.1 hypothetical protein EV692_0204 [Lonepinella koalarum]TFJ90873.1 hypothetical protein E0709_01010 [Lonepinella koalarum]TYG34660.1 hypothetical protein FW755_05955 [Lonepinella koalarum]
MNIKQLLQSPPSETYIKNSSKFITALFILAGILHYPTNGYGSVIVLGFAVFVLLGQKILLSQANKDFREMYFAKQQFEQTQNPDYLRYIDARSAQILRDNKVLSDKAKLEIAALREYVTKYLEK